MKSLKRLLVSVFVLSMCVLFNSTANAQNDVPDGDSICLKIQGLAMQKGQPIDGVNAKLYRENQEMEMVEVTSVSHHSHDFFFDLAKNSYYTIEVSKPGYITRMISISTKLPAGVKIDPIFIYQIELEMHPEKVGVDDYYLDFPIALIDYDPVKDVFVSHGKYTAYIKAKIKETLGDTLPQKKGALKKK
ncbi:MAG TPA: hypothetical protein VFF27_00845 [Bacteroidia bacterium]|jgi:hypothetical protein|nr:hypothetical protein [Bacteroidia bacterium]